ncbi:hypothetical protein M231_03966 [Tremella mesenterica]|uniref:Uncharacterized protein n=1 Tax=Tremella mesenterica TaxID=5217 RepID=A0A4Q1BM58_TREME|nr:hypothetical protein M231_03966 [Tremella mesenterica]
MSGTGAQAIVTPNDTNAPPPADSPSPPSYDPSGSFYPSLREALDFFRQTCENGGISTGEAATVASTNDSSSTETLELPLYVARIDEDDEYSSSSSKPPLGDPVRDEDTRTRWLLELSRNPLRIQKYSSELDRLEFALRTCFQVVQEVENLFYTARIIGDILTEYAKLKTGYTGLGQDGLRDASECPSHEHMDRDNILYALRSLLPASVEGSAKQQARETIIGPLIELANKLSENSASLPVFFQWAESHRKSLGTSWDRVHGGSKTNSRASMSYATNTLRSLRELWSNKNGARQSEVHVAGREQLRELTERHQDTLSREVFRNLDALCQLQELLSLREAFQSPELAHVLMDLSQVPPVLGTFVMKDGKRTYNFPSYDPKVNSQRWPEALALDQGQPEAAIVASLTAEFARTYDPCRMLLMAAALSDANSQASRPPVHVQSTSGGSLGPSGTATVFRGPSDVLGILSNVLEGGAKGAGILTQYQRSIFSVQSI